MNLYSFNIYSDNYDNDKIMFIVAKDTYQALNVIQSYKASEEKKGIKSVYGMPIERIKNLTR